MIPRVRASLVSRALLSGAVTLTMLAATSGAHASRATATCTGVQLGAFGKGVGLLEAYNQGFFTQEGLTVCYNQVTGSQQQFDSLFFGGYDIIATAADNVINRVVNAHLPVEMVAGTDLGPNLTLAVSTANGIQSIADLRGKPIAVDAPDSGFVFALRKILKANGLLLENGDYSLQVVGGTFQRYQALLADHTTAGAPVYSTLLNPPFIAEAAAQPALKIVASFSDYLAPYQGGAFAVTPAYAAAHTDTITAFLRAYIRGELYARDPRNRAAVIADIAAADFITPEIAAAVLNEAEDPASGDIPLARMNKKGLLNTIALRQEFNGFSGPIDPEKLVKPNRGGLYVDQYWRAAIRSLFGGDDGGEQGDN